MNPRKFLGVVPQGNRYRAQIGIAGRPRTLGIFDTPEEAAREYDYATFYLAVHRKRDRGVNFPEEVDKFADASPPLSSAVSKLLRELGDPPEPESADEAPSKMRFSVEKVATRLQAATAASCRQMLALKRILLALPEAHEARRQAQQCYQDAAQADARLRAFCDRLTQEALGGVPTIPNRVAQT